MEMMFWYGNAGWAFWQIALMWAFMAAFWGLLVWAAYTLITRVTRKPGAGPAGDGARRILDERLAAARSTPTNTAAYVTP
jgi:hypothetical protein